MWQVSEDLPPGTKAARDLLLKDPVRWCTYTELDGIGIHQLITGSDGDDAVTTARFSWDGTELRTMEQLSSVLVELRRG